MVERTGAQLWSSPGMLSDALLPNQNERKYKTYRQMREDPTIAFGRMLIVAPLVSAGWLYEANDYAPADARDFIEEQLEPLRVGFMKTTIEGHVDCGWSAFELVLDLDEWGMISLCKMKPLLQNQTQILVDKESGAFIGLRQDKNATPVDLSVHDSIVITVDVEGTNWYGVPLLENSRGPYEKGVIIEAAATRYDKKIAGTHLVVHYPEGTSKYNGVETQNFEIAKKLILAFEASGSIAVPRHLVPYGDTIDDKTEDAWKIELLNDGGQQKGAFIERQRYLDTLKVRGMGLPERAVLEGQYGTKAEAETHSDFAITNMEMRHTVVCQQVSRGPADLLLELNYGRAYRGTVVVRPKPLTDEKRNYYRDLYKTFLTNPDVMLQEADVVDLDAIKKQLGVIDKADEAPTGGLLAEYFRDNPTAAQPGIV
jgi:hypothetical protein